MVENKCVESGCRGLCCKDTDIQVTIFERRRLFKRPIRVPTLKELRSGNLVEGFCYYARLRLKKFGTAGFYEVGWNGACPNLTPEGNCNKHFDREQAARDFKFGSKECNAVRIENGLSPVFCEPVE